MRGQNWRSQSGSDFQLIHIIFIPCQSFILFLGYGFFKIWPWPPYQTHIPFVPSKLTFSFLRYGYLKIQLWKSKSKVMGKVRAQRYIMSPTSYRLASLLFQVAQTSHSWNTAFSKFDPENSRPRSWERFKAKKCVPLPMDSHPVHSMSIDPHVPVMVIQHFSLKIQG